VTLRPERARSFGAQAEAYDLLRPGYPVAALRLVLDARPGRVADVGAGTGKLSALLVEQGLEVVAVEPDPRMRAVLARQLRIDVRAGTAENLPLEDASVAAVLFGQAWHWTDPVLAAAEAERVLRADGRLAMLWNLRDDRQSWVAELARITRTDAEVSTFPEPALLDGFTRAEVVHTSWTSVLTVETLVQLAGTWSAVATREAAERARALAEVRALGAAVAGSEDRIDLPYVCTTWCYRSVGSPTSMPR
jgi:SAM-dependent methyltransferase